MQASFFIAFAVLPRFNPVKFCATLTALPIRRRPPSRRALLSDPFAKDLVVVEGDALVELLATAEAAIAARSFVEPSPAVAVDRLPTHRCKGARKNMVSALT